MDNNGWTRKPSYCKDGTDGTDGDDGNGGLDGELVGLGWDGKLLAPTGTGATEQERHNWLACYCKQGTNGKYGLDGALVGQGWDGRTVTGAGTGVPPWAPEQERQRWLLRGSALCEVLVATNIVGAKCLCWISKTIYIECTQIRTTNVVQDSIKCTYDTIILWLHTAINRTYNVIVPK